MQYFVALFLPPRSPLTRKKALLVKHGVDVNLPIWYIPWVWNSVTQPPPPQPPLKNRISGKLPTYPSSKPTLTLASNLRQKVGLGEGWVGSFPETYNDPKNPSFPPEKKASNYCVLFSCR